LRLRIVARLKIGGEGFEIAEKAARCVGNEIALKPIVDKGAVIFVSGVSIVMFAVIVSGQFSLWKAVACHFFVTHRSSEGRWEKAITASRPIS
jgi:hypothetical protein